MPNLFPRCCVLLLLAATSAVAQRQTDVASPGTGSVTGHVYCADTQKPARFAEVRLASVPQSGAGGFGGGERFGGMGRATTGPDGSFLLENVPPGDYLITARTPGYIDTGRLLMSTVIRNPNDPPPAALVSLLTSVHVTAGQPATASVTIYRGAVLAGVVSYDDGTPAYGVTVSALAADGTQTGASAMSDDRGVYRVTGLLDGTYILQARPFGPNWTRPLPVYYGNTLMKTAAKKLEVKAGDERDGLDLQIQVSNLRQVSGIVQSAKDGHGLGRATISMTLTGEGGEAMNTSSLPDGSFRFQNVPDGKFTVSVSGAQDHNTSGDSSLSYGGAQQNIEVHGGDIDHVVFNLTTSGSPSPESPRNSSRKAARILLARHHVNNHQGTPKVYRRGAFALLMLIVINLAMIALGVVRYPQFWLQPGARAFVAEPVCVLVAYAIVVIWIARTQGAYWDGILRAAAIFGVLTGALEIINIGIENGVPFSFHGPALQIVFMLSIFASWGIAGFRTVHSLSSIRAGLLAAVSSAGICMLIAVAAGFLIQFFLIAPKPDYVSTWAEFKRSEWTDPRAFEIANTLDSGFTHFIIAPFVALIFGGGASLLARFALPGTAPVSAPR